MKYFRHFLVFSLALLLLTPCSFAAEKKPNILFISIDDLNDWVGCLGGHPQVITPNIDKLAASGVNFTNAHCQAPICNPSRVSMLLGKLPSTTGMYFLAPNFREPERTKDAETIFQYFRKNGYYASTCGKIFHGKTDKGSFDHIQKTTGWRRGPEKFRYTVKGTHPLWDWGQVDVPDEEQRDYITAAWGADQIPKLAAGEKPFFLSIGFALPHVPIYASKKWFDLYPLDSVQLPPMLQTDREDIPDFAKSLTLNSTAPRHEWMVENDEVKHAVRAYLAANSFVDHLVGMLLDSLENSGAKNDTIVVLWSDHGFHLGEKLRWAKRTLWEETTRVPLIFAGPGISGNQQAAQPVGLIDVFPTLNEICGLPPKDDLEGKSLATLLKDSTAKWNRPTITTFGPNNHSIRSQNYRYTVYADGSEELFDHRNDPNEWINMATQPDVKDIIKKHRKWLPEINVDPLPGSKGSDSPLYGETGSLHKRMKKK